MSKIRHLKEIIYIGINKAISSVIRILKSIQKWSYDLGLHHCCASNSLCKTVVA